MLSRRTFIHQGALGVAALGLAARQETPSLEHGLTVISGKPRERGPQYGTLFKDAIRSFLQKDIPATFTDKPNPKEAMRLYAAACGKAIQGYSPLILDEMEGMAEGTGLTIEEIVLITNHEELWHRGVVPATDHSTVFGS